MEKAGGKKAGKWALTLMKLRYTDISQIEKI